MIYLKNIIKSELIFIRPEIKNKEQLFDFITEKSYNAGLITDKEGFKKELWERENKMSTEIAKGIAIPHVKTDYVKKDFVMVIISKKGIKYSGFASKVNIVFAIGTSLAGENYINVMAKIARFLNRDKIKENLLKSDVPDDILKLVSDFERAEKVELQKTKEEHYLIGVIVNNAEMLNSVEEILLESGLRNPTIIDSEYGIKKMLYNIPFLRSMMLYGKSSSSSKTIIGFTENADFLPSVVGVLKNEGIDFEKKGVGTMFSIKLGQIIGAIDEDIDF